MLHQDTQAGRARETREWYCQLERFSRFIEAPKNFRNGRDKWMGEVYKYVPMYRL